MSAALLVTSQSLSVRGAANSAFSDNSGPEGVSSLCLQGSIVETRPRRRAGRVSADNFERWSTCFKMDPAVPSVNEGLAMNGRLKEWRSVSLGGTRQSFGQSIEN